MVGSKGKGSKSKSKVLKLRDAKSEPETEPEPSQISPNDLLDVASDGEDGKNDISNGTEIPLKEETMLPGSGVSDALENDQKSIEENDLENHDTTEMKDEIIEDICTEEGTIADVKEVSDGGHTISNLIVEDNEQRIDADNPEEGETPLTEDVIKLTTENMSANGEALTSDNGIRKTGTDNVENDKEPSKLETDKPLGTPSDKEEENIQENANVSSEVKGVTSKVNGKRKLIKRKLVKKKLVRRNAVAQTSDGNNASCEVDADEHVNVEEKTSDMNKKLEEACKADSNENVSNEKVAEVKPSVTLNKKRNRIQKKNAQSNLGIQDTQKPQSRNDELGNEKHVAINEANAKSDKVEKPDTATPLKRNKNKKIANKGSQEVVSKDVKKPKKGKSSKKVESMGMIFMCSSETKKDCFRYNVLGLPSGKKDMVLKIYKGMRLFLFDVDLRMMYGIFKAAGPGGLNIEPRAFKSQFPSQVRFSVLEDCVPLAEERFRKVLKDNYYSKKKFNFQLNHEQVKNLCKLFHETSKKAESTKQASRSQRAAPTSSTSQRDKRKRVDEPHRAVVERPPSSKRERTQRRAHQETRREETRREDIRREERRREEIRLEERRLEERRLEEIRREERRREEIRREERRREDIRREERRREEIRHAQMVISDSRFHERPAYERETYVPPVAPARIYQTLPPPRSPPRTTYSYEYDRGLGIDSHKREPVIDSRDLASARELRVPIEMNRYESYLSLRDPVQVYSGQTSYSTGTRREHYDYGTSDRQHGSESNYYRSADNRPPPPPLPLYRRY